MTNLRKYAIYTRTFPYVDDNEGEIESRHIHIYRSYGPREDRFDTLEEALQEARRLILESSSIHFSLEIPPEREDVDLDDYFYKENPDHISPLGDEEEELLKMFTDINDVGWEGNFFLPDIEDLRDYLKSIFCIEFVPGAHALTKEEIMEQLKELDELPDPSCFHSLSEAWKEINEELYGEYIASLIDFKDCVSLMVKEASTKNEG